MSIPSSAVEGLAAVAGDASAAGEGLASGEGLVSGDASAAGEGLASAARVASGDASTCGEGLASGAAAGEGLAPVVPVSGVWPGGWAQAARSMSIISTGTRRQMTVLNMLASSYLSYKLAEQHKLFQMSQKQAYKMCKILSSLYV